MRLLRSFIALDAKRRLLVAEAALELLTARVLVHTVRFERIARRLGAHMTESPQVVAREDEQAIIQAVGWALRNVARNLPVEVVCLPQAIAAKRMLARRGVASTLYLGVLREDGLKAHAWLRAGDTIVTGQAEMKPFSVISTFA